MGSLGDNRYKFIFFNKEKHSYSIRPWGGRKKRAITHCPWCGTDLALFEKIGVKALWRNREPATDFCCREMQRNVYKDEPPIVYDAKNREYLLLGVAEVRIESCPWCPLTLPSSLKNERNKILRDLIGEDYAGDSDPRIPGEFQTDEWWLRRALC